MEQHKTLTLAAITPILWGHGSIAMEQRENTNLFMHQKFWITLFSALNSQRQSQWDELINNLNKDSTEGLNATNAFCRCWDRKFNWNDLKFPSILLLFYGQCYSAKGSPIRSSGFAAISITKKLFQKVALKRRLAASREFDFLDDDTRHDTQQKAHHNSSSYFHLLPSDWWTVACWTVVTS